MPPIARARARARFVNAPPHVCTHSHSHSLTASPSGMSLLVFGLGLPRHSSWERTRTRVIPHLVLACLQRVTAAITEARDTRHTDGGVVLWCSGADDARFPRRWSTHTHTRLVSLSRAPLPTHTHKYTHTHTQCHFAIYVIEYTLSAVAQQTHARARTPARPTPPLFAAAADMPLSIQSAVRNSPPKHGIAPSTYMRLCTSDCLAMLTARGCAGGLGFFWFTTPGARLAVRSAFQINMWRVACVRERT